MCLEKTTPDPGVVRRFCEAEGHRILITLPLDEDCDGLFRLSGMSPDIREAIIHEFCERRYLPARWLGY